jgi:hypothetical protein
MILERKLGRRRKIKKNRRRGGGGDDRDKSGMHD